MWRPASSGNAPATTDNQQVPTKMAWGSVHQTVEFASDGIRRVVICPVIRVHTRDCMKLRNK